jgi:hypothetical protein
MFFQTILLELFAFLLKSCIFIIQFSQYFQVILFLVSFWRFKEAWKSKIFVGLELLTKPLLHFNINPHNLLFDIEYVFLQLLIRDEKSLNFLLILKDLVF